LRSGIASCARADIAAAPTSANAKTRYLIASSRADADRSWNGIGWGTRIRTQSQSPSCIADFATAFFQLREKAHVLHQKVTGTFPTARDAVRRVRRTRTLVAPRTKAEHAAPRVHAITIRIPAKDNPGTTARGESRGRSFAHTCSKHG